MKYLELCRKYWIPQRKTQMMKIKISCLFALSGLVDLLWFLVLGISVCIKWHNITLPKNKIFINQTMIKGNVGYKDNCRLDGILSRRGCRDKGNVVVYRLNLSDNFWSVSFSILPHSHHLSLSPSPPLSFSLASLCSPALVI
jgi:hypothetical protein